MADNEPASVPAAPPPSPTLGQMLRDARLAQDLTVEQLSTELRIEARQLAALEDNRFEQIGVPVFVKGYLKQYGTRLGMNVADLLAIYTKQTTLADVQIQPSRTIKLRDESQITSWVIAAIVLLAVAAGLAWWWNGGQLGALPLTRSTESGAATPAQAEPVTPPEPERVESPVRLPSATLPSADAPAPEPAGEAAAGAPGLPSDSGADASAAPAFTAPDEGDGEPVEPDAGVPLAFSFERESWAEVTDARGERLVFGLNAAGRSLQVRGEPPFAVVLGDASAVELLVDGEPYAIPLTGREGERVRFSVTIAED